MFPLRPEPFSLKSLKLNKMDMTINNREADSASLLFINDMRFYTA